MTARQMVLKIILQNYPKVQSIKLESPHKYMLPSTCSRAVRELKKEGVEYEVFNTIKKGKKKVPFHHYDFSKTPKKKIQAMFNKGVLKNVDKIMSVGR
jgi:hypothetical protein